MNLYIQIKDGVPVNHPVFMDNLIQAFGKIPNDWEQFIRMQQPNIGAYQVLENEQPTYEKQFGYWMDIWAVRDMTPEEKFAKQQAVRDTFNSREQAENWSAWTLDEATCKMVPPTPRPEIDQAKIDAGILTVWCGAENGWKDTPPRPEGLYKFDFFAWQWVEITQ